MKRVKRIMILLFCLIVFLNIKIPKVKASDGELYLNDLLFDVKINQDGSMNVIEIWDIEVKKTNTLFKTFKTDSTKFYGIEDVQVTDITNSQYLKFSQINQLMYHVTKNCYYGLKNNEGDFEIAWGVGLDNENARKRYKIEYTVIDAVSKHNDYAQLYWQFVGEDYEIDAKKIRGTIYLPKAVENKKEIKVWGHTEDLNGEIYVKENNKIEFTINNFKSGKYVEIRTLFPSSQIIQSGRSDKKEIIDEVLEEETVWSEEANKKRERKENREKIVNTIITVISFGGLLFVINKIKKYNKMNNEMDKKYEPFQKLDYYREIPREDATPAESVYIFEDLKKDFQIDEIGRIFSATLLDLCLKDIIGLEVDANSKNKININILKFNIDDMQISKDEKAIFEFLKLASGGSSKISIKELQNYIENHDSIVLKLKENIEKYTLESLTQKGIINEEKFKQYEKYQEKILLIIMLPIYIFCAFIFCIIIQMNIGQIIQIGTLIIAILFFISTIVLAIKASGICSKINVITQERNK